MKQLIIILSLLSIMACNSRSDNAAFEKMTAENYADQSESAEESMQAQSKEANFQSNQNTNTKPTQQKLIRRANLNLEVEKYADARKAVDQLVAKHQAVIANESERRNYYNIENSLRIRVAPDAFEACISDLEQLALNVTNKSINSEDVTRQYVDLETRLASKRAVIEQYRSILQKAKTITDILAVEEKLRVVTEEIESTEAQLRYLKDQVGLSTIELTLIQKLERSPEKRRSFVSRVGRAFRNGWEGLVELSIGLVTIWPLILIGGGLIFLIRRFWRRRKAS